MFDDWSLRHALLFNAAISVLYIAPLYFIPKHIRDLSRDHDTNVRLMNRPALSYCICPRHAVD